ncbi:hypothetical protein RchiOBHm_Chr6g0245981 [Rosa chinensis]|uniref:Uncharacterized protein n=1 Tax=Rosa chinensis TaxID=74649 RepID=A0A2P6PJF4_ROSCH|nr:hypothetical protein RchiOBHm_Chr6g0245981 [Rosa chinensis]
MALTMISGYASWEKNEPKERYCFKLTIHISSLTSKASYKNMLISFSLISYTWSLQ